VCSSDLSHITDIPMRRGFLSLVAVMDWASRRVLVWRLSNTMGADFCIAALEGAMARHGRPPIRPAKRDHLRLRRSEERGRLRRGALRSPTPQWNACGNHNDTAGT
jgi:transposase InsO family protein